MPLLITDLDNTLYDWVTFFAHAFSAMVDELVPLLEADRQTLLDEFQVVHRRYGNSEQPFATLELPTVQRRFAGMSSAQMAQHVRPAFAAFRRERERLLRPYPGVRETLATLQQRGVKVVGHTEAIVINAYHRLHILGLEPSFVRLYSLEGQVIAHPDPRRAAELQPPPDFVRVVPRSERKPNPDLLLDICRLEGVAPRETTYVGDSLTRDIAMANGAGVTAVWARYGNQYDRSLWDTLVRVTHWTAEDVAREARLRESADRIVPDFTIDSYGELLDVLFPARPQRRAL